MFQIDLEEHTDILKSIFGERSTHDREDYLYEFGNPAQVILAYTAFCPQFENVLGHPVFGPLPADRKKDLERKLSSSEENDLAKILSSYRWLEIPYLFSDVSLSEEQDDYLAKLLSHAWRAYLQVLYPDRKWGTKILPPEITGSVVGVEFFET